MKDFNQLVEDMLIGSKILTINGERTISGIWPNHDFGLPFMVDFTEGGSGQVNPEIAVFLESELTNELVDYLANKNHELHRRLAVSEFQDLLKRHGFEHKHTRIGKEGVEHWRISLGYPEKIASEYYNLLFHDGEAWLDVVFVDDTVMVLISYTVGEFEFAEIADTKSIQTGVKTFEGIKQLHKLLTGEHLIDGIDVEGVEWERPSSYQAEGMDIRGENEIITKLRDENIKLKEQVEKLEEDLDKTIIEKKSADTWAHVLKCELYALARVSASARKHQPKEGTEPLNFGNLESLVNYIKSNIKTLKTIKNEWIWYAIDGHTREGYVCEFSEYTEIGDFAVSTIGDCWPDNVLGEVFDVPFYIDDETGNEFYYQTKTFLILKRDDNGKPIEKRELYSVLGEKYVDAKQNHHNELLKVDRGFYNE